jgi:hypothetical protein
VISKTKSGYQVRSASTGRPLSRPDLSKAEAEKRLAQIEMFKHMHGGKGK